MGGYIYGSIDDRAELMVVRPHITFYRYGRVCSFEKAGFEEVRWWLEGVRGAESLLDFAPPGYRGAAARGGAWLLDQDDDDDDDDYDDDDDDDGEGG